jgi:hypothetical protein
VSYLRKLAKRWVKKPALELVWNYRQATCHSRSLPDFIIIGAQKSGTSSLFAYLAQHPQLLPSWTKEVHFFDGGLKPHTDHYAKGECWYRAHFPIKDNMSIHARTFEASPFYIFNPLTPKRIFDLAPEVKLVAVLRNPTERAISQYFHEKRKGSEPLSLREALQAEEQRLKPFIEKQDYNNRIVKNCSYKSRGLYRQQLERFLEYFPMQQLLVLSSEEFFSEPGNTLRKVFEFTGVDTEFRVKKLRPHNVARNKNNIDPEVYSYLNNYYLPYNKELYELLGKDFGW